MDAAARDHASWRKEFRIVLPDGHPIWVYGDAVPQFEEDGSTSYYGYIGNINKRKILEKNLQDSESFNKTLFHNSYVPMLVIDQATSQFVECNSQLRQLNRHAQPQIAHGSIAARDFPSQTQ